MGRIILLDKGGDTDIVFTDESLIGSTAGVETLG
jgi:hypothetical protein